ncbi:MAG: leucyl aminopeptidase [Planctomycetia bacterium]|nr:leucyl aminopeptidase [Planctomycetia bacterium]
MEIKAIETSVLSTPADAVVVGVYADGALGATAGQVDQASGGLLVRLLKSEDVSSEAFDASLIPAVPGVSAGRVVVVGLGKRDECDRGAAFRAAGAAARLVAGKSRGKVAFFLHDGWAADVSAAGVAGAMAGCQGQDLYREKKNRFPFQELLWSGPAEAVRVGRILGEATSLTRRLVNEPPQEVYPDSFARRAAEVAKDCGLSIEVWDEKRLESERCGSLLAVGRGSQRPPRLVILGYNGAAADKPLLGLVGKGVTFDSGGLSLKPTDSMVTMKCDMAGAATVLGAMQAIARLKLPVNVIGLAGLVENMTGGNAMKLGDVLKARSGKTIEVLNTDAEGRLVLADVLNVAVDRGAAKIIDLATLTGACVVALGTDVAGLMTNDQSWCDAVAAAAKKCGEPAWQLPMFPEYSKLIKSEVADIKNIGEGRWGGVITAAKFLGEFVAGKPWVHIDIAGPAFLEKPKAWMDGGGTGAFVRTLVEVAGQG